MDAAVKQKLIELADKYEVPSFCDEDPSQFLRWYPLSKQTDVECASFIAAMLAFGSRKQFIPKIKFILTMADENAGSISSWILNDAPGFPSGEEKFYRFYSFNDLKVLFNEIKEILINGKNWDNRDSLFGTYFKQMYKRYKRDSSVVFCSELISLAFPNSKIVPKGKNSANKRVHMFLRWMVRENSSVDLGIWRWYPQKDLLIPLDTHVIQEAREFGLLNEKDLPCKKTAVKLTNLMKEIFPEDPSRIDFALFGFGVEKTKLT